MRSYRLFALLLLLSAPPLGAGHPENLSLYTFHSPPYQIASGSDSSGAVTGSSVATVSCVLDKMDIRTDIRAVPQNRALHSLQRNLVDGYFAADDFSGLAAQAVTTAPIALEKWYLYSRQPLIQPYRARIGVVAGGNEQAWLRDQGFYNLMTVATVDQLPALLGNGRVDAVVLDERAMDWQQENAPERSQLQEPASGSQAYIKQFLRFAPLHLFLNRRYELQNPEFINDFNGHLSGCLNGAFSLDDAELKKAEQLARALLDKLRAELDLARSIDRAPTNESLNDILDLDERWQALAPHQLSDLAARLLQTPDSKRLSDWQARQHPLVTEVFLMDDRGAITSLSQLTSDYWQGDEDKFRVHVDAPEGSIRISPVRFDASARRFQVTASAPVIASGTSEFVGAVAIGLNIERVLQHEFVAPPAGAGPLRTTD